MNPLLWLAQALTPSSALLGPRCADAVLHTHQEASLGFLWSDYEAHKVEGRLEDGTWRFDRWETLRDDDPAEALEEGRYPFPTPSVGAIAGQEDDTDALEHVVLEGRTLRLSVPERVGDASGWMEDLVWKMVLDERGWPIAEEGRATVGDDEVSLKARWSVRYEWTACSP